MRTKMIYGRSAPVSEEVRSIGGGGGGGHPQLIYWKMIDRDKNSSLIAACPLSRPLHIHIIVRQCQVRSVMLCIRIIRKQSIKCYRVIFAFGKQNNIVSCDGCCSSRTLLTVAAVRYTIYIFLFLFHTRISKRYLLV